MLEYQGKYASCKVFVDKIEETAVQQIYQFLNCPAFEGSKIRIMPDVHAGAGAVVGFTATLTDKVIPNVIGVDIGCVDSETEFLTPRGWKKISDWRGEKVMQYDPMTGMAEFVDPINYIRLPCRSFIRIHTKYGVDQKLSPEHKVLFAPYTRAYDFSGAQTITAQQLREWHERTKEGFRGRFITTFRPNIRTRVAYTNEQLRVIIMVAADGHFVNDTGNRCALAFKKDRKVRRARMLLDEAGIKYSGGKKDKRGVTALAFDAPDRIKTLSMWEASAEQLIVIANEVLFWDGNSEDRCFFTSDKETANFISYVFAATGNRSVMRVDDRKNGHKLEYRVFGHKNTKVGIKWNTKNSDLYRTERGRLQILFYTTVGFLGHAEEWCDRHDG